MGGKPNIPAAEPKMIRTVLGYSVGYNNSDKMLGPMLSTRSLYLDQCKLYLDDWKGRYECKSELKKQILVSVVDRLKCLLAAYSEPCSSVEQMIWFLFSSNRPLFSKSGLFSPIPAHSMYLSFGATLAPIGICYSTVWSVGGPAIIRAEVRRSFITTTVLKFLKNLRSHHKGATDRVRTGDQRLPGLCHCQLRHDIP